MQDFKDYKDYCCNVGDKPYKADVLIDYVRRFEAGDLEKCDVCGEMTETEYMHRARYDHDKRVCEQCRRDGS